MRPNALRLAKLGIAASTAAIGAGAIYLARDKIFSPASRAANDTSPTNPALVPRHSTDAMSARAPRIAERFRRVWPDVTGQATMPEAALEIALSQAALESGLAEAGGGGWWKDKTPQGQGNMVGSGNLGSRHCGAGDSGGTYYRCVPYGDSVPQPDGTNKPYDVSFRYYTGGNCGGKERDAGDCAAYDFLYDITKRWPGLAELQSGDVLAYAMKLGPKYGASDPPNQTVFGRKYDGGYGYYGGFGKSMQKRVGGYAYAIATYLPAIAAALGHQRIFAKVAPEILTYSDKDDEIRTTVAGVSGVAQIEGVGTVVAIVAGIVVVLVGVGLAVQASAEAQATQFLGALRTAGFDVVPPGAAARAGWRPVDPSDPALAKAAKDAGQKGVQALRALAASGYTFQTQRAGRIKLNPSKKPAAAAAEAAKLAAKPSTPALEEDRIPLPGNPAAAAEAAKLAAKPSTPALEEDRIPVRTAQEELRFERLNPDGTATPMQGSTEAEITEAEARASDAHAVAQNRTLEGAGAIAAVAAGGLVAGGLVAAAVHLATKPREEEPAAAPSTPPPPASSPTKATAAPSTPPPAPKAAPAKPKPTPAPAAPPEDEEPGVLSQFADLVSDDVTVSKVKRTPKKIQGAEAEDDAGAMLQALHLAGVLPRARALPVTGQLFWFLEEPDPSADAIQVRLAGLDDDDAPELAGELDTAGPAIGLPPATVAEMQREAGLPAHVWQATAEAVPAVPSAAPACPCNPPCPFPEPHVHAFCPEAQAPREAEHHLGDAAQKKPDNVDKAIDTASDVATIATSLLAAGGAAKKIAERSTQDPDPKCRELLREWVEKHPWLHRIAMVRGGPDLTALAGNADEAAPGMVDRYLDALMELRGAAPEIEHACAISPEEDRAVLVHLGATAQEIDAIYKVASRSAATVADLFAPGVGRNLVDAADAIRTTVDPTVQAHPAAENKTKETSAAAKCKTDLAAERAKVAAVVAYHEKHPNVSRLLRFPDPRKPPTKLAGGDDSEPAGDAPTIDSRPIEGTTDPGGTEG